MSVLLFWRTRPTPPVAVRVTREYPPLELDVELTSADGHRTRLSGDGAPGDRPQGLQLTSKRGEGFSTHSCALPRRADRDWPDLNLFDGVAITSRTGDTAWEGQLAHTPRTLDAQHSIGIEAVGWMAHAKDVRCEPRFVDRDVSQWADMSLVRRASVLTAGRLVDQWWTQAGGAIVYSYPDGDISAARRQIELHYQGTDRAPLAGLQIIGQASGATPASWTEEVYAFTGDDTGSTRIVDTPGYLALFDGSLHRISLPAGATRLAFITDTTGTAATPATGENRRITAIAAYGAHGLPLYPITDEPDGVLASDALRYVFATYCPLLRAGDYITDTHYPIGHLTFPERTHPYDVALAINKLHLFELAVWEDREVHWSPADLTDYDWEIRADDPGVKIKATGDSIDDLANGIEVEYDDVNTGRREVLLPADHPELRDPDVENPVNRHGRQRNTDLTLTSPASRNDALQIGRMALAEFNQPKAPGEITAVDYVRDRAGNFAPAWKVRATDTIAITSSTSWSDRPRLVGEATYDHDRRQLVFSVDSALQRVEAYQDRLATALKAKGLV